MNAIDHAISELEERLPGLTGNHMSEVIARGGVAFWSPDITYMGIPLDLDEQAQLEDLRPDAPEEHSLFVLYIGGDMTSLPAHFPLFKRLGYTHLIWSRGMKPGTNRWRRASIDHFSDLFTACQTPLNKKS